MSIAQLLEAPEKSSTKKDERDRSRAVRIEQAVQVSDHIWEVQSESHPEVKHRVDTLAGTCTCAIYNQKTCWHRSGIKQRLIREQAALRDEFMRLGAEMGWRKGVALMKAHMRARPAHPGDMDGAPGWMVAS